MKSQLNERLLNIATGLLKDVQLAYPTIGVSRDLKRLTLLSKTRGLGLFTLDLPSLDSLLLEGLRLNRLHLRGPISHRVSQRCHVPEFLQGLWLRVFDRCGVLRPDADPTAIAFLRQLCCLGKKITAVCTPDRIKNAVKEYIYVDRTLSSPTLNWAGGEFDYYIKNGENCSFLDYTRPACEESPEFIHKTQEVGDVGFLHPYSRCSRVFSTRRDTWTLRIRPILGLSWTGLRGRSNDSRTESYNVRMPLVSEAGGARDSEPLEVSGEASKGASLPVQTSRQVVASLASLQLICDEMCDMFPAFHSVAYSDYRYEYHGDIGLRHGPGAVSDAKGKFDKFEFPTWPRKLESMFPFDDLVGSLRSDRSPTDEEYPSQLIAVPKTAKTPRLIACEPTSLMWAQQLLSCYLQEYISYSPFSRIIDFRRQDLSREMVRLASCTGDLATVDLSSASDRLSCKVIERMFRKHPTIIHALYACRTSHVAVKIGDHDELIRKNKFASQGSAVTFPIQTLFFACCVLAVMPGRDIAERVRKFGRSVRVFGDDIILPRRWYAKLRDLLDHLELKVNDEKSFHDGLFRESCGFDGFKGYDVTPVKPMSLSFDGPESRASSLDFSNNLFIKGYWNAAIAAESTLQVAVSQLPVVGLDSGSIGLTSFCGGSSDHLYSRWNKHLHKKEVRIRGFTSRVRIMKTDGPLALLRFFSDSGSARRSNVAYQNGYVVKGGTRDGAKWVDAGM